MTVRYRTSSGAVVNTPCTLWPGLRNDKGYGLFHYPPTGKLERAHRIAYIEAHGLTMADIKGVVIRHTCDNKPCFNPDHLLSGTLLDNARDARERNLYAKGERHWHARLTEAQVVEIKRRLANGQKQKIIAADFKVTRETVTAINNGRCWSHVP